MAELVTALALSSMSTPKLVKREFRAGTSSEISCKSPESHKVAGSDNGKIPVSGNRPGAVAAARGATQEVETPMPAERTPRHHGRCLACGDEWTERGEIVVCPECHSLDVVEEKPPAAGAKELRRTGIKRRGSRRGETR